MIFLILVIAVAAFVIGQKYGSRVEKEAVAVALAAFTKAKTLLSAAIVKAQADARAEVARLEDLAKKYL